MILAVTLIAFATNILYQLLSYVCHLVNLRHYPKGPTPLPFLGNLHKTWKQPLRQFKRWSQTYGDIFSFSIGTNRIVVLNSAESIHEALVTNGEVCGGRPSENTSATFASGVRNLSHTDHGGESKLIRKMMYSSIAAYGGGNQGKEELISKESDKLIERLIKFEGKPLSMRDEIDLCIFNVICTSLVGHSFNKNDKEFKNIVKSIKYLLKNSGVTDEINVISWLKYLPLKQWTEIKEANDFLNPWIQKKTANHCETFDINCARDITDNMIKILLSQNKEYEKFEEKHLNLFLIELIVAGTETTALTICWAIIYLLHHPHLQDELFEEIEVNLGDSKVKFKDQKSLPLMCSVIQETLRLSSVVPLNLAHKSLKDTTICGKKIPKNTTILTNLFSLHHNKDSYKNPFDFNPKRWLDEDKKFNSKIPKSFKPFSAGTRICVGQLFAKTQLFLILTSLVKNFKFEIDNLPNLEAEFGLTLSPEDYKVKCIPR